MTNWPISLSTGCFYQLRFIDVIHEIRDAGFDQIEVCSFPRHLDYHDADRVREAGALLRQLGVAPFSFHAPFADAIDITSFDESQRESSVQELMTACEAAALMGCANVVLHPGPEKTGIPVEAEFVKHLNFAARSLNRVAERCCELNVQLLLENMLPHLLFGRVKGHDVSPWRNQDLHGRNLSGHRSCPSGQGNGSGYTKVVRPSENGPCQR